MDEGAKFLNDTLLGPSISRTPGFNCVYSMVTI